MPLHPAAVNLLNRLSAAGIRGVEELPLDRARRVIEGLTQMAGDGPGPDDVTVHNEFLPHQGPMVRIYRPTVSSGVAMLVWFHGGGWTLGSVEVDDVVCRCLAVQGQVVVLNVDYRLAPENPFPAALNDGRRVLAWARENATRWGGDATRVAVGGQSAGGNLATAVSLSCAIDGEAAPCFQLLVSPALDSLCSTDSYKHFGDGYFLTKATMEWSWSTYAPSDLGNPLVSPISAEQVADLPRTMIVSAEFDPLRDEAGAFAHRMVSGGGQAEVRMYPGMIHGFFSMPGTFETAREAIADAATALRQL
ncbi:MAG: acetyl esterase [Mycobacterium sp.]|jgi:acetyl esterase|nr:acetyl esterase [Mycobacterium sp.]